MYPDGITNFSKSFTDVIPQAGGVTLNLGFNIPTGTGWIIDAIGTIGTGLFRNSTGAVYPYNSTGGDLAITGPNNALAGYYYFFYDWKLISSCPSERTPITVSLGCTSTVTITGTPASDTYEAADTIFSDATILSPEVVIFRAGTEINLTQNFGVELGAEFDAIIGPCSNPLTDDSNARSSDSNEHSEDSTTSNDGVLSEKNKLE